MSQQDMSDKRTFQAYAQLPYKPFQFLEPSEQLNLRLVANIDPDQLYYRGDLDQASAVLKNFVNSHIPENMDYEMFNKLFRLSQLAIEYYSQEQAQRQDNNDAQYYQYKQLQEQEKNLTELKAKHSEKKEALVEKMKQLNLKIKELKKESEKIGSYKCVYCSKAYREREGLDNHVKRRHLDMLNEIQETKDMIKERQDPTQFLKKKQQEEIREQNKIQLERLQNLQKQLEQSKINEQKLVEQISTKLKEDFDMKISKVVEINNDELQKEMQRSAKKQKEFQEKESLSLQKDQEVNVALNKMNQNLENFEKAFQKIQEAQDSLSKQQGEYTKQLEKISQGQDELKKSSLQQANILKEQQQSGYSGSVVSTKTVPIPLNIKQNSKQETFPVQAVPTADFTRDGGLNKSRGFFNQGYDEDDSFMNNNSAVGEEDVFKNISKRNNKVYHIGDLEDDFDSQDEDRKAYIKKKEEEAIRNSLLVQMKNQSDIQPQDNKVEKKENQFYLDYQEPPSEPNISVSRNLQKSAQSLNQIAEFETKSQVKISDPDIQDDRLKQTKKNQQNLLNQMQQHEEEEEEEEEDEEEEVNYFKQGSIQSDGPKQPNVLSNQMSFGIKKDGIPESLNIPPGRKSNFSKDIQQPTISEQYSKEQQKSFNQSDLDIDTQKKAKKEKKSKEDKKRNSSSDSNNTSQSSISDISAAMKNKNKKQNKSKNDSQGKQSSRKSIGNLKDIPSPNRSQKEIDNQNTQNSEVKQEDLKIEKRPSIIQQQQQEEARKSQHQLPPSNKNELGSATLNKKGSQELKAQQNQSDIKQENVSAPIVKKGSQELKAQQNQAEIKQENVNLKKESPKNLKIDEVSKQKNEDKEKIESSDSQDSFLKKSSKDASEEKIIKGKLELQQPQNNQTLSNLLTPPVMHSKNTNVFDLAPVESMNVGATQLDLNDKRSSKFGQDSELEKLQAEQLKQQQEQSPSFSLSKDDLAKKESVEKKIGGEVAGKENQSNQVPKQDTNIKKDDQQQEKIVQKQGGSQSALKNEEDGDAKKPSSEKKIGSQTQLAKKPSQENSKQESASKDNKVSIPPAPAASNKNNDLEFDLYKNSPRIDQISMQEQDQQIANNLLYINQNSDDEKSKQQSGGPSSSTQRTSVSAIGRHQVKHEEKKSNEEDPNFNSFGTLDKDANTVSKSKLDKIEKKYGEFSDDDDEDVLGKKGFDHKKSNKIAGQFDAIEDDDF